MFGKRRKSIETIVVNRQSAALGSLKRVTRKLVPIAGVAFLLLAFLIVLLSAFFMADSPETQRRKNADIVAEAYEDFKIGSLKIAPEEGVLTAYLGNPYRNIDLIVFYDSPGIRFKEVEPYEPKILKAGETLFLQTRLPYYGEFAVSFYHLVQQSGDMVEVRYLCAWENENAGVCRPIYLLWK